MSDNEQSGPARWIEEVRALRAALEDAATAIERGNLEELMCCDGRDCGCRGSTHADLVLHHIREAIAKSEAK